MLLNCGVEEDAWESLGLLRVKPVNPKENQSWIFTGRTDAEAPILWPPDVTSWLIRKDPMLGTIEGRKWMTENEMVGWHQQLNGHEFEQALGDGEGQGSLACCSSWGRKWELEMTEQLNIQPLNIHTANMYQSIHIEPVFKLTKQ